MRFEMKLKENVELDLHIITLSPNDFKEFEEIFDSNHPDDLFYFLEDYCDLSLVDYMQYYVDRHEWLVAGEEDVFILRVLKGDK